MVYYCIIHSNCVQRNESIIALENEFNEMENIIMNYIQINRVENTTMILYIQVNTMENTTAIQITHE